MFSKKFVHDAAERVAATFLEAAIGVLLLAGVLNVDVLKSAALAGVIAALALVKSLIARAVGSPDSAALLPSQGP